MNRRKFLTGLGALIGGIALEEAIPFNRVWSFPKEITRATIEQYADFVTISDLALQTAIDPTITQVAKELGYRAGQTYDLMAASTAYYDKAALDNLKRNLVFADSSHIPSTIKFKPYKLSR